MHIVVGVVLNKYNQVLITKRSGSGTHPNMWEFPGGKVEDNEDYTVALARELQEELGIIVKEYKFLDKFFHHYEDVSYSFIVYLVTGYTGNPICKEKQQDLIWENINNLSLLEFPAANNQIISCLLSTT
ncbi:MAG: hypothetical protein A3E88_06660 [Legionellales bacterium RIFCSPHIGHO2_12_FULL_35_11]|nr:MAG: hypothetical protein A3E88_06660 [Legionellales bacterium RIFCSPHIGHO2_12_FULL_35_11]